MDRRWVQRLIDEERLPALWLVVAGITGLTIANVVGAETVAHVLEFGGPSMSVHRFVGEGLLAVFFFVAGLELRHEVTVGSLNTVRAAAVPVAAAIAGMLVPAFLFILVGPPTAREAWGVPMATDLPIALALLAFAGKGMPTAFRAFLLSLAIVDDALSIIVVAIAFGTDVSLPWLTLAALCVGVYAIVIRRSGVAAAIPAVAAWLAMLHTGVHPTVLGVALGLATTRNTDDIRERWQPFSAYVAVPLFVATALAIPLDAASFDSHLVSSLSMARIVGKPLGIWLGAMLAIRIVQPPHVLPRRLYALAGSIAGAGLSVSVLFASLTLEGAALVSMLLAIVIALVVSAVVAVVALRMPSRVD